MGALAQGLGFIFDIDGVIIDSNGVHTEAWERYLAKLGVRIDNIEKRMHGKRNDQIVEEFLGRDLPVKEVFEHGAAKERLYREMIGDELEKHLVPGIREFIERYPGVPMGVASNAEPANVEFVLGGAKLLPYFQAVIDGHQVTHPKPHPEVYLKAADVLGLEGRNCIVFEDSPAGVASGVAAGARVVGVEIKPAHLDGVSFSIRDFRDERLPEWLARLSPFC
jgi:HAD superfamily hydrolase (TIGR01509 family)